MLNLEKFPRATLCHRPTPLELMPRLSEHLGGPSLWIKRDDCTGLAMGGNKTRKLEFLFGDALASKADTVVTQGAVQSNHVRQTAAAACRFGLKCHVLLERRVPGRDADYEQTGNVMLDQLFGATIEFREAGLDMNAEAKAVTEQLREQGRNPYFIPGGGSNEIGALGYVDCARELVHRAELHAEFPETVHWIVMATGSTGTQAGLVAGLHALQSEIPLLGVSVRQKAAAQIEAVYSLANRTAVALGAPELSRDKILVNDEYVGDGYGLPTDATLEAILLASRYEGILLDPVYSAKGFAGMVNLIREGFFGSQDNVVFLHTGGASALFAYQNTLQQYMAAES